MFYKFFTSTIDHALFLFGFIIGVQAPEFIQQYTQRILGHLDEAKLNLKQFQTIADFQFNGDLQLMINTFSANSDKAIVQTGELISNQVNRVDYLTNQVNMISQTDYVLLLFNFFKFIDVDIARATLTQYVLAIPLTFEALTTGVVIAFTLIFIRWVLFIAIAGVGKKLVAKDHQRIHS